MRGILKEEFIMLDFECSNYKEAIEKCFEPLLNNNYINNNYIESIFENIEKMGVYIDIGKNIALPHSRPEKGVYETAITFLRVKEEVEILDDSHNIKLFFGLAAKDDTSHLSALQMLVKILNDDNKVKILKTGNKEEILKILYN